MTRFAAQFARHVMVVLLALALAFVGFGHRMGVADPVDLTAYAMPDGTQPALCLDATNDDLRHQAQAPCPACIIAAAMQMPQAVTLASVVLSVSNAEWPAPADLLGRAHLARAPPARGPPAAFLI